MTWGQVGFGVGQLLAQAAFALFIAWKAVGWALARYKREKLWERRLALYSEIIATLAAMRRVCGVLFEHHARINEIAPDHEKKMYDEYRAANSRFEEAAAGATMILPTRTIALIKELQGAVADVHSSEGLAEQALMEDAEYGLLNDAIDKLEQFGREDLA